MKSILLKVDDKLFEEIEAHVKESKISRSSYIKKALETYNDWVERKKIEAQLRKEVLMLKESDSEAELMKDFETASLTDLNKYFGE